MSNLPSPISAPKPFLTIINSRRPVQKTHAGMGPAKNAINNKVNRYSGAQEDMQLFRWVDDDWELVYDIKRGDREMPWEAEEASEARKREKRAQERAEVQKAQTAGRLASLAASEEEFDSGDTMREVFERAFFKGYMKAKEEK